MRGLSSVAVAALALALALTVMYRRRWQGSRFTTALMLLAGFGLSAGLLGETLQRVGGAVGQMVTSSTSKLFGVGVPAVILIAMITWIVIDLRDRQITTPTPWLALALPTMLAVVGGVYIGVGDDALALIGQALTGTASLLAIGG